jgi:hypothetical protein
MPSASGVPSPSSTIVFFSANPSSLSELDLEGEIRAIRAELAAVGLDDVLQFLSRPAATPADLQRVLLRERPAVIQFSGHGRGSEASGSRSSGAATRKLVHERPHPHESTGIMLQGDGADDVKVVSGAALGDLFAKTTQSVRLVFLNACHSVEQAEALLRYVDFVVGIDGAISDQAAKVFAVAFYRALAYGRDIQTAFDLGVNALMLEELHDDVPLPVLQARSNLDPRHVALVAAPTEDEWDVFVSYARDARDDRDAAEQLALELHERMLRVFFFEWQVLPGDVMIERIEEGIRESRHAIMVVSVSSMGNSWLRQEYAALLHESVTRAKLLIPVIVGEEDVEIPPFLKTRDHVDLRNGASYAKGIERIVKTLRRGRLGPPLRRA